MAETVSAGGAAWDEDGDDALFFTTSFEINVALDASRQFLFYPTFLIYDTLKSLGEWLRSGSGCEGAFVAYQKNNWKNSTYLSVCLPTTCIAVLVDPIAMHGCKEQIISACVSARPRISTMSSRTVPQFSQASASAREPAACQWDV